MYNMTHFLAALTGVQIVLIVIGVVALVVFFVVAKFFNLYIQALLSGARVSFTSLIGMFFRKVPSQLIVYAYIKAKKVGLNEITVNMLEGHFLAGGNVIRVVDAVIIASRAGIVNLDFEVACGIDLAGRDVLDAVTTSVNPKVIDVPNPSLGRSTIDAVAKDGIQLKAKAKVTVQTNIEQLIGGATEDTVIARVGEGIVTTIGSADSHKKVLENPDLISKTVLSKGLDSGTAFRILSIDIADVDVGDNIGAILQGDQAEADKRVAQAKAEMRRAAAVALEQEMLAKVQEMQSKVVEAQAQVPLAMAAAFRDGNLGILDYHRLENIKADTKMRSAVSADEDDAK